MKTAFADLHLNANLKNPPETTRALQKAATLGYSLIAVPSTPEMHTDKITWLQTACKEAKIDFASRIDIRPRTQDDLLRQLRRLRRNFQVVCVYCENKEVSRQAAKDRRVDLLNFPSPDFRRRFFDRAEAELSCSGSAALEIDVKPLLVLEGPARTRLLSSLRREAAIAREFHVPIIISSGASAERLLRKPREMAALAFLFDLDEASALKTVSTSPVAMVKRNREKLSSKFIAPGIRVLKEGKDC